MISIKIICHVIVVRYFQSDTQLVITKNTAFIISGNRILYENINHEVSRLSEILKVNNQMIRELFRIEMILDIVITLKGIFAIFIH